MGWIILFFLLLTFCYWRALWQKRVSLRYQYRLYALRDELRMLAIDGKIDPQNWIFDYIDSSISRSIDHIPRISLYGLFAGILLSKNTEAKIATRRNLEVSLAKSPELLKIYEKFGRLLIFGTMEKHRYSMLTLFIPIAGTVQVLANLKNKVESSILELRVLPEGPDPRWSV